MKFSAVLWKRFVLLLALALFLGACAARLEKTESQFTEPQLAGADAAEGSLAASDVKIDSVEADINSVAQNRSTTLDTEQATSRILSSQENNSIGLELSESKNKSELLISTEKPASDYTVTRLNDPERLVIDIKGQFPAAITRSFDASDTEFLSSVRVGSHPDKGRVVLDLANDRSVQYKVDSLDGNIVVSLASSDNSAAALSPSFYVPPGENADSNSAGEQIAALPDAPVAADAVVDVTPQLSETAPEVTLVNDESAAEVGDESIGEVNELPELANSEPTSELNALNLEQLSPGSNMLVAKVTNPGAFNLKKTAPSEYVLTLKNTAASQDVQPVVALPEKGLIRSARMVTEGEDVQIRIFAQSGTALEAKLGSDKILVTASNDPVNEALDMRAQAAPEKVEGAGEAAPAKPAGVESKPGAEVKVSEVDPLDELSDSELSALEPKKYVGRQISLDLQDTDIDNALRIIAEVSNLNIIASDDVTGKVTLRLIDVPWDQALDVILKTNGLDKVREGNVIRIAPIDKLNQERQALKALEISQAELEPLQVKYIRVSYAKASDLKPLVETVISERGVVSYDERTNQLIIKDISNGLRNVMELVGRIDLRTPQVLLETQIVEASRTLVRELGAELGFDYIASPETGNATGKNFPNTIDFGGSALGDGSNTASSFPAATGSAVSLLLGSADGSRSLGIRISALEDEGRARVISRPAVATTNNKPASIRSVEKIRVKTPDGGLSVATGQGAAATGASSVATETIEVGITLDVTPQASPDYYVLLDIKAKSSTFGAREVEGIPSEIERSANSTVLVSSGQTFAMGGIYKISDIDSLTGVPFFKDIPFLGTFFRRSGVDNSDEELLFFITPRIIEGSFDDATMKVSS